MGHRITPIPPRFKGTEKFAVGNLSWSAPNGSVLHYEQSDAVELVFVLLENNDVRLLRALDGKVVELPMWANESNAALARFFNQQM